MIKPFGPYVVFGPPGSGKSHLLSQLADGLLERHGLRSLIVSDLAEDFSTHLVIHGAEEALESELTKDLLRLFRQSRKRALTVGLSFFGPRSLARVLDVECLARQASIQVFFPDLVAPGSDYAPFRLTSKELAFLGHPVDADRRALVIRQDLTTGLQSRVIVPLNTITPLGAVNLFSKGELL
jgi:energy-coupling factor transporter ATP-binding protein EcfA2